MDVSSVESAMSFHPGQRAETDLAGDVRAFIHRVLRLDCHSSAMRQAPKLDPRENRLPPLVT